MKTIILFRHGKSRWDMGVNDIQRNLEETGIERTHKSAQAVVGQLKTEPQAWFSSPAVRAFKTAQIAHTYFSNPPEIQQCEELYTFSFFDLLKFIKKLDNSISTAIFFGHNEAYTEFVNRLGNQFIENLPTSGVVVLKFNTDEWKSIEKGITEFILKPKKL